MSEENKILTRRWIEEMDKKNFAIIRRAGHTQPRLLLSRFRTL